MNKVLYGILALCVALAPMPAQAQTLGEMLTAIQAEVKNIPEKCLVADNITVCDIEYEGQNALRFENVLAMLDLAAGGVLPGNLEIGCATSYVVLIKTERMGASIQKCSPGLTDQQQEALVENAFPRTVLEVYQHLPSPPSPTQVGRNL